MSKYRYITNVYKGVKYRYRTWFDKIIDEDTGKQHDIKRHILIKVNDKKVYWNPL